MLLLDNSAWARLSPRRRPEVRPHVPGAWVDDPEGRIGYEIPFTRRFYRYERPRSSETIKVELEALEQEIHQALTDVLRP